MIYIKSIELSDRDSSTDVVDMINLSDGRAIASWNGQASYCVYDKTRGRIEVGAQLVSTEDGESYYGEGFKVYIFA